MSRMSRIESLVHCALIGTRQEPPPPALASTPFERLLDELPAAMLLERKLLLLAGAEAVYALAGTSPFPLGVAVIPAPAEKLPPCSPQAAALIKSVLQESHSELLPLALELLARHGRRLPFSLLPTVFAALARPSAAATWPVLAQVIGERGRWLIRQNPSWRILLSSLPVTELSEQELNSLWYEGSFAGRLALLRQLRTYNRPLARQWLEEVWPQEQREQRLALLETFEIGLEQDDEAFLEKVRNRRSYQERRLAVSLLLRLPSSACRRELPVVAHGLLQREQQSEEGYVVRVVLPETPPPSWQRFGIEQKSLSEGQKQHVSWLQELISLVPPGYWEERLQLSPASIVHSLESTWRTEVLAGLVQATRRHRLPSWARALLSWADAATHEPLAGAEDLLSCLEQEEAEQFLLQALASSQHAWHARWPALLTRLPRPWSTSFGVSFLEHMQKRLQELANHPSMDRGFAEPEIRQLARAAMQWHQQWEPALKIAARALPANCLELALQLAQPLQQSEELEARNIYFIKRDVNRQIITFIEEITFHHRLLREFENQ
ncbi:DUF5691 domain-containing protein [Thermogemmatispora carboxidivorans]|uniref:DUF5691 domain-containing protein n=1 Tax=Thermogemmatispora carboxidivorans TaxID=1382306 RepID=UPI00069B253C|nr:DUF5691 domain-containing protein [Thermogemmatispora carboxidivorans]